MDKTERICWLGITLSILTIGWLCNKPSLHQPKQTTKEIIDSNLFYDEIEAMYQSRQLSLYDSIETLNNRLKIVKDKFNVGYSNFKQNPKIVLKIDSLGNILYNGLKYTASYEVDSNCFITLNYANETINQQDSIINLQSRGLDACSLQVDNLRKQVEHNQDLKTEYQNLYNECSSENKKLGRKVKRNRLFAGIVSAILVSFVLIK